MALVRPSELLRDARLGGYAVGYFEAWDTYSMEAVVGAAEAEGSPVVLGFGGMTMDQEWLDRFGIEPLGAHGRSIAESARVPAALILNEVWELDHAVRGIEAGFNIVMLNACELPLEDNVRQTRALVHVAHPKGVEVQAELGRLPAVGSDDPGELTDPEQAREFVTRTGVDLLAISIGNVHLRTTGVDGIDYARLRAIRAHVDVPLVIHGGSGLSDEAVQKLISEGVALFHVGTIMKKAYLHAAAESLATIADQPDYQTVVGSRKPGDFLLAGRAAITQVVRALMRLYGSSGRVG